MAWCDTLRGYVHPGESAKIRQADPCTSYLIRVEETRPYSALAARDKRVWGEDEYGRYDFVIGVWLAKVGDSTGTPQAARARQAPSRAAAWTSTSSFCGATVPCGRPSTS